MPIPEWVKKWIDKLDDEIVKITPESSPLVDYVDEVESAPRVPDDPIFNWWTQPLAPIDASEE